MSQDTRVKKLEAIAVAANNLIADMELVLSAPQARLALALHDLDPTLIGGKENCTCDDPESCDECAPAADILAYLKATAGPVEPQPEGGQQP